MQILTNHTPEPTALPGIAHVTLAGSPTGLAHLSVWKQSMDPGHMTPPHQHGCEEVVLCVGGTGELLAGEQVTRFGAGQTIVIPAGVPHQLVSVGPGPLETIAAFNMTPVPTSFPDGQPIDLPWQS